MATMSLVPAAQYLRKSTEHQQYSLSFQTEKIRSYASQNHFQVIKTYSDPGKSGLSLKCRPGLAQLLHDVVAGEQPFRAILVYDVTRWGRFQDADESAHYEFLCRKAGIPVHYCAEVFSNNGAMHDSVMKALKRVMAAEYSRELSTKVFEAMKLMIRQGYWAGSQPGYGLRRMLVYDGGRRTRMLRDGQPKDLKSGHVVVVPGPAEEVAWIREIFRMYVKKRMNVCAIARFLNEHQVPRRGLRWNYQAVMKILFHEKYAGTLMWARRTQKLATRCVPVPKQHWVVQPGAIKPIVERKLFDQAQAIRAHLWTNTSNEDLLNRARRLLALKGRLNADILNRSKLTPSAEVYIRRFGGLRLLYKQIEYTRTDTFKSRRRTQRNITRLHCALLERLKRLFPGEIKTDISKNLCSRPIRLRFSSGLKVSIAFCLAERSLRNKRRWRFQTRTAQNSGLVTLLCLCNDKNTGVRQYVVLPDASVFSHIALIRDPDPKLAHGVRLEKLADLRKVAHSLAENS